jgi:hypothetical protein
MGYFTNAFIFTAHPRFEAIAASFPTSSVRGYQHLSRPTWLLDLWPPPRQDRPKRVLDRWRSPNPNPHFPFKEPTGATATSDPTPLDANTQRFLDEFQALLGALAGHVDTYGLDECRLALSVAARAAPPTLFFVSDDESFDFACLATPAGPLQRLRCRLGPLVVVLNESGSAVVEPTFFPEEEEDQPPADLIAAVRRSVPWPLAQPVPLPDGAMPLFGNALALWPASAGDPDELLGWDAFENLDRDYRLTFERLA